MGNSFCKRRVDVDSTTSQSNGKVDSSRTQSSIDKIISRVQLCPRSLTRSSEEKMKHKESKRNSSSIPKQQSNTSIAAVHKSHGTDGARLEKTQSVATITPASSEWMEVALEVPDSPSDKRRFIDLIANNGTPIPPPRKHRKKLREKIESITKNVIGGLHGVDSKTQQQQQQQRVPVDEPPMTRTIVKRHVCDIDECRNHAHGASKTPKIQHQKNHSTVSLPNYSELALSVPKTPDRTERARSPSRNSSAVSLPGETKKTTILETYMTRCRSFGSLLPHQILEKLKSRRVVSDTAESDDSWGGLEDWDLGVIEHYKPHESSLPRPMKDPNVRTDFPTGLNRRTPPVPPVRRSESIQKRLKGRSDLDLRTDSVETIRKRDSPEGPNSYIDRFIESERSHGRLTEDRRGKIERTRTGNEPESRRTFEEAIDALDRHDPSTLDALDTSDRWNWNDPIGPVSDTEIKNGQIQEFVDKLPKICDEVAKDDEETGSRTPPPTPEVNDEPKMPTFQMRSFDEIRETVDEHSGLMKIINVMAKEIDGQDVLGKREEGVSG